MKLAGVSGSPGGRERAGAARREFDSEEFCGCLDWGMGLALAGSLEGIYVTIRSGVHLMLLLMSMRTMRLVQSVSSYCRGEAGGIS